MSLKPNTPKAIKADATVQDPPEAVTRLDAVLAGLPAEERTEVWRGIALKLAEQLHSSKGLSK